LPFQVEPGQSVEPTFQIALSPAAVRGEYPVHAFAEITTGGEGMLRVARTVRVDFPTAPGAATPAPIGEGRVVELRRPPELTGLNGVLEQWRLEALSEYVRTEDEPVEGGIFRLGAGPEAFKVAVIPGDHGLLDGWFLFVGPEPHRIHFHGLRLALRLPVGVTGGEETPPLNIDLSKPAGGDGKQVIGFDHFLSCGDWGTMVRIEVRSDKSGLEIRATSEDQVVSLGLGSANLAPVAMTGGLGLRVEASALGAGDAARSHLKGRTIAVEFPEGVHLLATATGSFGEMQMSADLEAPGVVATHAEAIRLIAGTKSPYETALRMAPDAKRLPTALQRLWLDLGAAPGNAILERLEELNRFDAGPKGVILRPDSSDFGELQEALNRWGIPWSLDELSSEVSPLAPSFDYQDVAFGASGDPLRGRAARYLVRPDRMAAKIEPSAIKPKALVLGQCDALAGGFHDRGGHWFSATESAAAWDRLFEERRRAVGADGLLLARGAGVWIPAKADGAILPPIEVSPSAVPVPWPVAKGPGVLRPSPSGGGARADLRMLLSGEGLVASHRDWGREMARRAWFLRPVVAAISGAAFTKIESAAGNHGRLRSEKGPERTLWTNWSSEPWKVDDTELAPWGFRAVAPGLEAGREALADGVILERLETADSWYVNTAVADSPSAPALLDCRIELGEDGVAHVDVDWLAKAGLPFGSRPVVILAPRDHPAQVAARVDLNSAVPPGEWFGRVASGGDLPLRDLAVGDFTIAIALVTPGGRPLVLDSAQTVAEGPFAGYACPAGKLTIERIDDGIVEEIAFFQELDPAAKSRPMPERREERKLADAGWAATNGGFRLERHKDGFRLIPLPDSGPFEIRLRPEQLGFAADQVVSVVARELYGGGWESRAAPVEDGELRWKHEPRIFAYDLILR
jgi:hypothetical protein